MVVSDFSRDNRYSDGVHANVLGSVNYHLKPLQITDYEEGARIQGYFRLVGSEYAP